MGINYEPLSDPPPPSLKFVSGGPGVNTEFKEPYFKTDELALTLKMYFSDILEVN